MTVIPISGRRDGPADPRPMPASADAEGARWLPVVGYEGSYEVSDQGRVRSVDRIDMHYRRGTLIERRWKGKILIPQSHGLRGYLRVFLSPGGNRYVHVLVMEAFVGPVPGEMEVAHDDGDARRNELCNLKYSTHIDNESDKIKHGTLLFGEAHGSAKLTADQVNEIRSSAKVVTGKVLSEAYGVSLRQIYRIKNLGTWKHLA